MRLEFWRCSCNERHVGMHITAIYHSTRISLKFRKETGMWWCRCAASEFLLKVIHTDFYCIAEARFSRRNPSSLRDNTTSSAKWHLLSNFYFSFYGELQYYQASQHAYTSYLSPSPKKHRKGGKKQHQQHQSRFVSKAFPFHALPQMAGNPVFLSAREKHARSCGMRLDWEQQRRRKKKIHEHDKRSEIHHRKIYTTDLDRGLKLQKIRLRQE